MPSSLKKTTLRGVGWSAADTFLGQGVTFIIGLVLARILGPEEYGLIGIVTIFTSILLGFVDCGFSNALIRKRDTNDEDFNTMFIVNLALSIAMYALLFIGAPLVAEFFHRSQLVGLVRVSGVLLIIQSFSIVQETLLKKKIDFKTKAKASFMAAVISGFVGIGMAIGGFGVWSLVGQQISRQTVYTISLWFFNKWWPKFNFKISSLRYMWGFGWKLALSGLLDRVWTQIYQVIVGKFYDPATLGQYSRSKEYANIFSSNLTSIVQKVTYPVLSQVQDEQDRMISGYRRIIKTTMFVTAIILIAMGAVAEPLIFCLIGPQWQQAATFLPLICISMSLYPLHAINLNMLQVQGRTDIYLYVEIAKKILAILPICLGIFVNIYWMLIGTIMTGIISFFLNSFYTGKKLGYSSLRQLKDVAPGYLIAIIIALCVYFLKYLPLSNWVILPLQAVVGIVVFFLLCELNKPEAYIELKNIAIEFAPFLIFNHKTK